MSDNLVRPSSATVKFLKGGIVAFHPKDALSIFSLPGDSYDVQKEYGGYSSADDFDSLLFNITGKQSLEDAAILVLRWEEGRAIESNIPANLDEKISQYEESLAKEKTSTRQNYEQIQQAKKILLESQKFREEVPLENVVPVDIKTNKTEDISPINDLEEIRESKNKSTDTSVIGFKTVQDKAPDKNLLNKTAEFRQQVDFAEKILQKENPERAVGLVFLSRGITSDRLEKSAQKLESKAQLRVNKIIKAIRNTESSYPTQTKLLRQTYSVQEVTILLSSSQITQGQITAFFSSNEENIVAVPNRGVTGNFFVSAGQQLFGYAANQAINKVSSKVTGEITKKITSKIVSKAAGAAVAEGAGAATGAALGTAIPVPVLNWVIGAVVGWVSEKVLSLIPKIIQKIKEHPEFGAMLVGGGIVFSSPALVLSGVGTFAIGGISSINRLGVLIGSLYLNFLYNPFVNLVKGIVITFVAIVITIVLAIFIINSGAYIVPPDISSLGANPYIDVTKTVEPDVKHENSELSTGIKVTYHIKVIAKKTALENLRIEHVCEIITKSGSANCPAPLPSPLPLTINPETPFTFDYPQVFSGPKYVDSLVVNTFKVTADSTEAKDQQASGVASILIGNPPTECFAFDNSWDNDKRNRMTKAIVSLTKATTYSAKLCQGNKTITLKYLGMSNWGGWAMDANTIGIYYYGVMLGDTATLYTLAHETGHILAHRTSEYSNYINKVDLRDERPICSYPVQPHPASEDFAEMIGLYIAKDADTRNGKLCGMYGSGFKNKYPRHWEYANKSLFGGQMLGW